jgi:hypothetical protein
VTGVSERGSESVIRYWVQERISKKHAGPEPQTAEKRVQAYLKLALQVIIPTLPCVLWPTDLEVSEAGFDSDLHCPRFSNLCSFLALERRTRILASRIQQHETELSSII